MSKKTKHREHEEEKPEPKATPAGPQPEQEPMTLEQERNDLLGRLQRVSADYMNYQKRVQRDITQVRQFANEELIKALLGVLDDMERALDAARSNHDPEDPLLEGMVLVHSKALETLGKFGLEIIEADGKPFNPEEHSAMMQEPSTEHPPQTVLRELQKGYRLRGRTIRPTAVVVSTGSETEPPEEHPEQRDAPQSPEEQD